MKSALRAGLAALTLVGASAPAFAQADDPYAACAATADATARLACFDATYARERESRAERREQQRERTAEEFGLTELQIRERDAPASAAAAAAEAVTVDEDGDQTLTGQVADAFTNSGGKRAVLLTNGQLWTELSNSTFRGTIRPEWQVEITKSWSGGYRMRFAGKSGFLSVKRLR